MIVAGRLPARNSAMAATICAGSRPTRRGTGVSTERPAGWQPEHAAAPAGMSAAKAAVPANSNPAVMIPICCMSRSSLRSLQIVVLQRQRADALAGCGEHGIAQRGRDDRDRRLADPAPDIVR